MKNYLFILLLILCMASCKEDDETMAYNITISVKCERELPSSLKVVITNQTSSLTNTFYAENGTLSTLLEPGIYSFQVSGEGMVDYQAMIFTGLLSDCQVNKDENFTIPVSPSVPGSIVLKEVYYTGCKGADGKNYLNDQYFALYNNSTETAYLDNLCIAFAAQTRASSICPWGDFTEYDYCAAYRFVWAFPSSGMTNVLLPGQEVIIAANCIDHTALGNTLSVNLSGDNCWAAYNDNAGLTKQTPPATADGKSLNLVWKTSTMTMFSCSFMDPAIVIFRPTVSLEDYVANYITKNPANASDSYDYLMIPHEWIVDGVEIFDNAARFKRLPPSVDAGYALNELSISSRTSVCRKVDEKATAEAGFNIYQDTNNSSEDFIVLDTPTLIK